MPHCAPSFRSGDGEQVQQSTSRRLRFRAEHRRRWLRVKRTNRDREQFGLQYLGRWLGLPVWGDRYQIRLVPPPSPLARVKPTANSRREPWRPCPALL